MEFFHTVHQRQSVRKYQQKPIEPEKLQAILDAANRAPSAGNFQAYEIFVVRGAEKIRMLADATFDQKFVAEAPVALIFCANPSRCQYQPPDYFALQDTSIATTFAMMAVTALGLSACWVGAFIPEKVAGAMQLPQELKPVAILPIGYAGETPERTTRREISDLVHEL